MYLLIDVGNTATKFVFSEHKNLTYIGRLYNKDINEESLNVLLKDIEDIDKIYITSVNPVINDLVKAILSERYHVEIINVDVSFRSDIEIRIDDLNELGEDLYADIVAGHYLYKNKVAIIDMGTATKILFIDKDGVFSSCAIFLGFEKSKLILSNSTALLPNVKSNEIKKISDCHNTVDVINSSTYFSQIDTINGIISRYEEEVGYKLKRVYTGGNATAFIPNLIKENEYDNLLLFKGMIELIERRK